MTQCALAERTTAAPLSPVPVTAPPPRAAAPANHGNSTEAATIDERAVIEMHAEHRKALYGFLVKLTGDQDLAEDLVQEAMLRAWRNLGTLNGSHGSLRPWLLTVARRLAIDAHRVRMARPSEVSDEVLVATARVDDPIERNLTAMDVRKAVRKLDPAHREVVVEMYLHGLSVAKTAEKLGIPEGTVKSRCYYGLRSLRKMLKDYGRQREASAV
jgi:RNA polymerase sigma-70 factor (ECF subfamily)